MPEALIPLTQPPRMITPGDPGWPRRLADLSDPPLWIRVAGSAEWPEPAVAIVGTRHASEEAELFAGRLAADLCAAGCTVISGGAYGIDAAAHQGALGAGGHTVAVLATGLREAYPPRHGELFGRIAQQGALITEALDDQRPWPGLFLRRNRLIAVLAGAVVVVQAPGRSGALSTAAWARQLRRPLFAVPSAPWDPRGQGNLDLIRQDAAVCTSARDVLSVASPGFAPDCETVPRPAGQEASLRKDLDGEENKVLEALSRQPSHPDEIARRTALPASRVQRALLTLVLSGMAVELKGGGYVRTVCRK